MKVAPPNFEGDQQSSIPVLQGDSSDRKKEFFKLQIIIFRNASLFPSENVAVVSPVASAKIGKTFCSFHGLSTCVVRLFCQQCSNRFFGAKLSCYCSAGHGPECGR